jgi:hypothetical protein
VGGHHSPPLTPPNTVAKTTPLAVTRSASDASLSVIASIDENDFELVSNGDTAMQARASPPASNYGESACQSVHSCRLFRLC